ncbi:hypothetical protein [Amycolatopsis sp. NPDC058986]|uniref:hypothetical protein n=1 Tax=unclassified Amycolatopsis TaxID=2618356 RepID=UPI00366D2092
MSDRMSTHLTDDQLVAAVARPATGHLADCADCRARLAGWQNMAGAARAVSHELTGEFGTPTFDSLLGPVLPQPEPAPPVEVVSPGLRTSWRLVAMLTLAQLRLLPRSLAPLTLLGFAGSVLLAVLTARTGLSTVFFGLAVTLVIQLGTLTACSARSDPRIELMATMPVTPAVVFANRIFVVLALDTLLALAASAAASALGAPAGVPDLIAGWLGQAMFASAVGVVCAVWRSTATGAVAGFVVWLLGLMGTVSGSGFAHRLGSVIAPLWSTAPTTLLVALLLLLAAVPGMGRPRYGVPTA